MGRPALSKPQETFAHSLNERIIALCRSLDWSTCAIPEYTDDQAFMDKQDTFGPHAYVAPAQLLGTWVDETPFQSAGGRLVGFAWVEEIRGSPPLPSTYTDLDLRYGLTCVYLHHDATSNEFHGYFSPLNTSGSCDTTAPSGATAHDVRATASMIADSIPPVARFREITRGSSRGNPSISLRCGNKICFILPHKLPPGNPGNLDPNPDPHRGVTTGKPEVLGKVANIHTWHDWQTLALPPETSPGPLRRSDMEVSVVPSSALLAYNTRPAGGGTAWPADFVLAADVYFATQPRGKYLTEWRFRQGHNYIFLKRTSAGVFEAQLRHIVSGYGGTELWWTTRVLNLERFQHSTAVPSTARFMWNAGDDDLWIACEDGCCKVAG